MVNVSASGLSTTMFASLTGKMNRGKFRLKHTGVAKDRLSYYMDGGKRAEREAALDHARQIVELSTNSTRGYAADVRKNGRIKTETERVKTSVNPLCTEH